MKTIVFLYAGEKSPFMFEKSFDSQSAFDRALAWASKVDDAEQIVVLSSSQNETLVRDAIAVFGGAEKVRVSVKDGWTTSALLHDLAGKTQEAGADFAVYAWGDCPFLDVELTRTVVASHIKYLAEYTFADGYPYGFAPETIDRGALNIMAALADGVQKQVGDGDVSKTSIFSVMKGDINSFEIETVIAPKDWRQLRLDFSCSSKGTFLSCKRLYDSAKKQGVTLGANELTLVAESDAEVQQTVPSFYNVQIASKCCSVCKYCPYPREYEKKNGRTVLQASQTMSLEQFKALAAQISSFSDTAVVGLGAWGEPLTNPRLDEYVREVLSHDGLSALIETDGTLVTAALAAKMADVVKASEPRRGGQPALTWIVSLDANDEAKFNALHGTTGNPMDKSQYLKACDAVRTLEQYFPGDVYPQFLRVNENEDQLESFYRYWHDKGSPSMGKLIIQKYDSFCGMMSDEKPADLSPLERNPCWHLKRDMTVLVDGGVPFCRESLLDATAGNVFTDGVEKIWAKFKPLVAQQIAKNYNGQCKACDEYYTFNF